MQESESPITITSTIILDGQGHTINANGLNYMFNIKGTTVILKNITLINAKSSQYGAVNWEGSGGKLENVNFINCTATGTGRTTDKGGVVYWSGATGSIDKCHLTNAKLRILKEEPSTGRVVQVN